MMALLRRRLHSLHIALTTIPDRRTWYQCGVLFGASSAVALATGFQSRLLRIAPLDVPWSTRLTLPVICFFFPGIVEEVLFRGMLLPHPREDVSGPYRSAAAAAALAAFVLWHPLQSIRANPNDRRMLNDRRFLFQTGILGSACTGAYYFSGSIWPPVVMHWLTVTAWVLFLGGRRIGSEA